MRRKEVLFAVLFAVIGGIVGAVVVMGARAGLPTKVQTAQIGKFHLISGGALVVDSINCRRLTVEHPDGTTVFRVGADRQLVLYGDDRKVAVGISAVEHGGRIDLFGKESAKPSVEAGVLGDGDDSVTIRDGKWAVGISAGEHGGSVLLFGKESTKPCVEAGVLRDGDGSVTIWRKDGSFLGAVPHGVVGHH